MLCLQPVRNDHGWVSASSDEVLLNLNTTLTSLRRLWLCLLFKDGWHSAISLAWEWSFILAGRDLCWQVSKRRKASSSMRWANAQQFRKRGHKEGLLKARSLPTPGSSMLMSTSGSKLINPQQTWQIKIGSAWVHSKQGFWDFSVTFQQDVDPHGHCCWLQLSVLNS